MAYQQQQQQPQYVVSGGNQRNHIPDELPSSSVHLISPQPTQQQIPRKMVPPQHQYHQQQQPVPSMYQPNYPPAPQHHQMQTSFQSGSSQQHHQMQTSFQSQHGSNPQQLLMQLQGRPQPQQQMQMVQPPTLAYAQQQNQTPYQELYQPAQPVPVQQQVMGQQQQPQYQQQQAPPQQPPRQFKTAQVIQQQPRNKPVQQQSAKQVQMKQGMVKQISSIQSSQEHPLQQQQFSKVVSKKEINFQRDVATQRQQEDSTHVDQEQDVKFKKTGNFGPGDGQRDTDPIVGQPHPQRQHYDTSPNRPPTFSNNLQESQQTDLDGTASYQTVGRANRLAQNAQQTNKSQASTQQESTSTQQQPQPDSRQQDEVVRSPPQNRNRELNQPVVNNREPSSQTQAQTSMSGDMVRISLVHETSSETQSPLPRIEFAMPQETITNLFGIVAAIQKVPRTQVTVGMIEHTKDALWLLNKVISGRELSIQTIFKQPQMRSELLANLNQTLETYYASQPELILASLRVLVSYLQKLDSEGQALPIDEVKNSNLIGQGLTKCLLLDPIGAATSIHLTLKTLTQISFTCPSEIGKNVVTKVLEFCGSQDDIVAQDNSIKLICNLLTNEKSCQVVLDVSYDVLNGIYQCLQSASKSAVKFALGALLNLTLLKEDFRQRSSESIMATGGLSHLVCAVQKSYNANDFESMHYGMKAFINLVKFRAPVVKILTVELGYLDIVFQLCRQMYQTVVKSTAQEVGRSDKAKATKRRNDILRDSIDICLALLDSVAGKYGTSKNKESLVNDTGFLPFVNRIVLLSVDKPADLYQMTIVQIVGLLSVLSKSAWKFSKKIAEWEQEELAGNLLSLLESTDSDTVMREGLSVFIVMQESGLLLSDEIQNRLKELHAQQNSSQLLLSQPTKDAFKRIIYLLHNTPFEKVQLATDEISPENAAILQEYKRAQQEASQMGNSFKQVSGNQITVPAGISPLKRRLNLPLEESNPSSDQAAKAYQNQTIPTKQPIGSTQRRLSSRQRNSVIQPQAQTARKVESGVSSKQSVKLSRNNLVALDQQSSMRADSQYGADATAENLENDVHLKMLNRLETISLQESTRKGQSRALSLIAGANNKPKPRGASSVAAIGGPLPPKIPPPTGSVTGGGNYEINGHRKQSQLHAGGAQSEHNAGLSYQVDQQRSKSLIRGATTSRPSGIGTGTSRLIQAGGNTFGRQREFQEHVEKFSNQLDPLLKGQTIEYIANDTKSNTIQQQIRKKASSTLVHDSSTARTINTKSTAYNAISSVEETKQQLAKGGGYTLPEQATPQRIDTQRFLNQNIYDIGGSVRSGGAAQDFDQDSIGDQQPPWDRLNDMRAESRGSQLGVHLQNFGLKNNPQGGNVPQPGIKQGQMQMVSQSVAPDDQSDAPPEFQEEYQQPTYESYYAQQVNRINNPSQKGGANAGGGVGPNFQPVNPFPSLDIASPPTTQSIKSGKPPQTRLHAVTEEDPEENVNSKLQMYGDGQKPPLQQYQQQQSYDIPQPVLQPKQMMHQRPSLSQTPSQSHLQQQQQHQPPRTIDEMVRQNQRIIAEKSQRGQAHAAQSSGTMQHQPQQQISQAAPPSVKPSTYAGQETDLASKYADVNLMDKDSFESRQARFQMGIGMPEARALLKRTNGGSFRQQVEWFAQSCTANGPAQAFSEVKQAVCSQQNTQKLVSLYVLSAAKMGMPIGDYFNEQ